MINIYNGSEYEVVNDKHIIIEPIQTDVALATAPSGETATAVAGGSLADDTYYYKVSAVVNDVETDLSGEVDATTSGTDNSVTIAWSPVAYATRYYIYKSIVSGSYNQAFSVDGGQNFTDNGAREIFQKTPPVAITHSSNPSSIRKDLIENVFGIWNAGNDITPQQALLVIEAECVYKFEISEVANQATWLATEAGLDQAVKDVISWI